MLHPKDEKLLQIESSLKIFGMQLANDINVKMNLLERMDHHKVPSVSMAIIDENELKLTQTYGSSSETAVYQAGSISKPVAALVALLVAKQYELDLDEDVNLILERYGSNYRVPDSEFTSTQKVTLRRLLSHTAGLTVHGFLGYPSDTKELPTTQQIVGGQKAAGISPTNSPTVESFAVPGTVCQYSGGGTTLVQLLLETVTGEKFPATARKYVLDPLEMKSSGYEIHRPGEEKFSAAMGHDHNGKPIEGDWHLYPESAAAGLWTTPADLARFMIEIQKAFNGKKNDIIPKDVVKAMLTKQDPGEFGLGPEVDDTSSLSFSHGGVNEGFQSQFMGFVNGKGAVVMTNSSNGMNLIKEIIPSIAAVYEWPARNYADVKIVQPVTINPTVYENYINDYRVGGTVPFKFATENNKLVVWLPYPGPTDLPKKFELTPESETSFFHISDEARFRVTFASKKAETFKSSFGEGVRVDSELTYENQASETSPSVEHKTSQVPLSSTSKVALAIPMDTKAESTISAIVTKASEQNAGNEPASQASEKCPVKDVELTSEDTASKDPAKKKKT